MFSGSCVSKAVVISVTTIGGLVLVLNIALLIYWIKIGSHIILLLILIIKKVKVLLVWNDIKFIILINYWWNWILRVFKEEKNFTEKI